MAYAQEMANSKDQVDKRFINLYLIRKADQKNIRFGLSNDILLSQNRGLQKFREDVDHSFLFQTANNETEKAQDERQASQLKLSQLQAKTKVYDVSHINKVHEYTDCDYD